ncbi:MAG: twin-arginine translocase subunit TatC [Candidimonas sp.]|nr:MAG: twin-arginine translocase subunit TatC [Candidimonas sp.]TAM23124.1 MAG: twin-arginine translocase subunit TatC [Candidimonas sp.]TAM77131.1 MAG: twin-arginine translocase subunit TatC [Candidimonas sp.]
MTQDAPASPPEEDTFISHLIELRSRLIRAVASVLLIFVALFIYPGPGKIYDILAQPMLATLPPGSHMIAVGVITPFMVPIKVTLLAAFVLALPIVLYQAWAFVAPGLYKNEKRLAMPLIISSTLLFLLGMAFCYFVVFHIVFHFIATFAPHSITPSPDIEAYLSFVMTLFLAFGVAFEVPIVVILLVKTGMVTVAKLRSVRGYVIVGAFIIAAVVTPPDALSQFTLAFPLCILFEIGVFAASMLEKRKARADEAEDSSTDIDKT